MKINDKEFLNPQQQLYQNTKDIEDLKEKYKNEVYTVKPFSEWPEDTVLPEVEDPREFTYVPRSITNVPADAKFGYLLINVENSFEPANSAALLFKIKSVNNSTVYIEFYANVASHVPGPQGEQGETGPTPVITAAATIDSNIGTPSVNVVKTGTDAAPILTFNFSNLKGEPGQTTIGIEVVAELPATGEEGVIYFVPKEDSETGDEYEEYTYVNDEWELLGSAQIDLTDYALKSEIPVIDEDIIPKSNGFYNLGSSSKAYSDVWTYRLRSPFSTINSAGVGGGQTTLGYMSISTENTDTTTGTKSTGCSLILNNLGLQINKDLFTTYQATVDLGKTGFEFNNLYLNGKINPNSNGYGLSLPATGSLTADKTLATTDQIPTLPTYSISNVVTDNSDVLGLQVTDGSVTYNIHNTTANPTLAGTESDLTSIDIGGTAYKIPNPTVSDRKITLIQNGASASFTLNQDSDKQITLPNIPTGTAASCDTGTGAGNVPVLDSNGKLSTSVLPAIAVTDTFVVSSEAAMLALTAQVGDIAVRTDLNKSFILQTADASVLSHWQELLTPTDSVTSVNGQTGAVTLSIPTKTSDLQNDSGYITSAPVTSVQGRTGAVTITQADLNIVYSATQPSNPVTGMIWIAPAS